MNGQMNLADKQEQVKSANESASLKILMVSARYFPYMGGVETHVYEVARKLAQQGVDITVLTTDTSRKLSTDEVVEGVKIKRVRAWPAKRDYYIAPEIYRVIRDGGWDVIHCQGYHTFVAPLAMFTAQRAKIPFVVTFHSGGHSSRLRNAIRGIQRAALRPLFKNAKRLVGVSQFEAEFFQEQLRLPQEQFVVIPNGAALPKASDKAADQIKEGTLILSVGRLERYKGHHRLIAALPWILLQRPDARLRIAGAGPYEAELRTLAQQLGVEDHVEIGPVPPEDRQGMATLLSKADIVSLFSEYEAHPVAVMEAVAMGCSVLVSDTSGLRELAQRQLVRSIPLESTDAEIAQAIVKQLEQPYVASQFELPTWEGCASDLLTLYSTIIRRFECVS